MIRYESIWVDEGDFYILLCDVVSLVNFGAFGLY